MKYRYLRDPHPHLLVDEIVSPEVYDRMRFPDSLADPLADWGITEGDPAYDEVLGDPHWRDLHDELRGEPLVRSVLAAFAQDMREEHCLVDPQSARLVPFTETREQKSGSVLGQDDDPGELFTRLDFQTKADGGYRSFVHLDWARRIVGGILFFSDADEEGMEGGELALYRDRGFRNDRWCHDPEMTAAFRPRHNTGVIFLNSNRGFHGPRPITSLAGRRRWLYYTISSRCDVWPHAGRQP